MLTQFDAVTAAAGAGAAGLAVAAFIIIGRTR
jgi:hypothetical protein